MKVTGLDKLIKKKNYDISKKWLMVAVLSLAVSGLYSIILALLRVPQIHQLIPYDETFRVSLIVHVDLSVIVWFLSMHIFFLANHLSNRCKKIVNQTFWLTIGAIILITISPFVAESKPYLNNYIPILHNVIFILGLSIFLSIYLFVVVVFLIDFFVKKQKVNDYVNVFLATSAFTSIIAFFISYVSFKQLVELKSLWEGDYFFFFEHLFWGGGHVLQFTYIAIGQFIWVYLFIKTFPQAIKLSNWFSLVFILNLICVVPVIYFSLAFNVSSSSYIDFYTFHMKHFGGISTLLLAVIFLVFGFRNIILKYSNATHYLVVSALMFAFGGGLGFMIEESNTTIPAHYHGSIVGITIAIMGYIYEYLKKDIANDKFRKICVYQIYLYFTGQFLHIVGLAFSGGYGALRKTPGGIYTAKAKFFLGVIGGGGLLAMLGGFLFVYIVSRYLLPKNK